jgi:FKBP-type peptidyl-prolyl cis-trans isomerase 2
MAEHPPSIWVIALFVVVILVVAGVAGAFFYEQNHRAAAAGPRTVAVGDNVTVNYIGLFGSGAEQGRVFDTSELSVARDNLSWPKSLEYTPRGNASAYTPLGVHVGPNSPSSGYTINNTTFGGVVTGFWEGIIGLAGNQTESITIPPGLAYGPSNASCLVSVPLVVRIPVVVSMPATSFATNYPNVTNAVGTEFTDPTYHWSDLILSANSTSVSVENLPPLGFVSSPNGWPVSVTNVSNGVITVTNEITPADAGLLLGHSKSSVCSSKNFIVSAVNAGAGTYTENFNREVAGQTLIFVVTVVDIYP